MKRGRGGGVKLDNIFIHGAVSRAVYKYMKHRGSKAFCLVPKFDAVGNRQNRREIFILTGDDRSVFLQRCLKGYLFLLPSFDFAAPLKLGFEEDLAYLLFCQHKLRWNAGLFVLS